MFTKDKTLALICEGICSLKMSEKIIFLIPLLTCIRNKKSNAARIVNFREIKQERGISKIIKSMLPLTPNILSILWAYLDAKAAITAKKAKAKPKYSILKPASIK